MKKAFIFCAVLCGCADAGNERLLRGGLIGGGTALILYSAGAGATATIGGGMLAGALFSN
jgi:hypothetical protein